MNLFPLSQFSPPIQGWNDHLLEFLGRVVEDDSPGLFDVLRPRLEQRTETSFSL